MTRPQENKAGKHLTCYYWLRIAYHTDFVGGYFRGALEKGRLRLGRAMLGVAPGPAVSFPKCHNQFFFGCSHPRDMDLKREAAPACGNLVIATLK